MTESEGRLFRESAHFEKNSAYLIFFSKLLASPAGLTGRLIGYNQYLPGNHTALRPLSESGRGAFHSLSTLMLSTSSR
jgi:hypothetical protein